MRCLWLEALGQHLALSFSFLPLLPSCFLTFQPPSFVSLVSCSFPSRFFALFTRNSACVGSSSDGFAALWCRATGSRHGNRWRTWTAAPRRRVTLCSLHADQQLPLLSHLGCSPPYGQQLRQTEWEPAACAAGRGDIPSPRPDSFLRRSRIGFAPDRPFPPTARLLSTGGGLHRLCAAARRHSVARRRGRRLRRAPLPGHVRPQPPRPHRVCAHRLQAWQPNDIPSIFTCVNTHRKCNSNCVIRVCPHRLQARRTDYVSVILKCIYNEYVTLFV